MTCLLRCKFPRKLLCNRT